MARTVHEEVRHYIVSCLDSWKKGESFDWNFFLWSYNLLLFRGNHPLQFVQYCSWTVRLKLSYTVMRKGHHEETTPKNHKQQ